MSFETLRSTWQKLGHDDPLWAVLTHEDKRDGGWNVEEFYATGIEEVSRVMQWIDQHAATPRGHRALDFGCGVGRLSAALATHFERVDGVDVAQSMLQVAEQHGHRQDRIRYHLNERADLQLFADRSFDLVYSTIVLQHMPAELQQAYIREFGRVLADGGTLTFQLPERPRHSAPRLRTKLRSLRRRLFLLWNRSVRGRAYMDMFGSPRATVRAWLEAAGLRVVAIEEDDSAGPAWISLRYLAVRPPSDGRP